MTEEQATSVEDCTLYNCTYTYDDVGDWAFEENRQVGDTYVYNDQTNQRLLVFYMLRLPSRSEQRTVNVRQILFTPSVYGSIAGARSQAQSVLSEWGTDPSERHLKIWRMNIPRTVRHVLAAGCMKRFIREYECGC